MLFPYATVVKPLTVCICNEKQADKNYYVF
jgi:hypothetical protein